MDDSSRKSSRFQHLFEKLEPENNFSGLQSRKFTEYSQQFVNDDRAASEGSKDIFNMNIPINYGKD